MNTLKFSHRTLVVADTATAGTVDLAQRAARSCAPILICGDSGTGKELIARLIHEKGPRSKEPFVSINCAAIPDGLLEAELFGHEKGAFTGAVSLRVGKFERASQGTLLLDEISEMPVPLQAKILRVLQENEIDRLGGEGPISIHTRIIATTNQDPLTLIRQKRFREDLFYRLNVIRIDCPPLKGRKEAIRNLALEFAKQAASQVGLEMLPISEEAYRILLEYDWPGNIRELKNVIERGVFLSEGFPLTIEHFTGLKRELFEMVASPLDLANVERNHIMRILEHSGGNRSEAAHLLGITSRTLRNKLKLYNV